MSIRHMAYVACDSCGDPAGGPDDMGDNAREARESAAAIGFTRSPEGEDWCPKCRRHWTEGRACQAGLVAGQQFRDVINKMGEMK